MPPASPPEPDRMGLPALEVGALLGGRYRLVKEIGRGGMAVVYQARDEVGIKREVAIKVLLQQAALSQETVQRFHLEADTIARLDHPHVIKIYDKGETPEGVIYLVMELLRGETLAETAAALRERGELLPWARVAPMMGQVCDALHAAHEQGVIHRDVKPSNCFRSNHAGARSHDFIRVLDFGIAKISKQKLEDSIGNLKTNENIFLGTLHYASPEAIQETSEPIDGRADMFAVGVMMYQLLTGTLPFEGATQIDVLYQTAHSRPERPTRRAPHANIPPAVEEIILRAMEINPRYRYSSMMAMSQAIHAATPPIPLAPSDDDIPIVEDTSEPRKAPDPRTDDATGPRDREPEPPTEQRRKAPRLRLAWWHGSVVLLLLLLGVAIWNPAKTEPNCGDGVVDDGEECDDGNTDDTDACLNICKTAKAKPPCGDGVVDDGEECDDGNRDNTDACLNTCKTAMTKPTCGDGVVDDGEQCDDGNRGDADACLNTCKTAKKKPTCGDGMVDDGEQCDDGNRDETDACLNTCKNAAPPHKTLAQRKAELLSELKRLEQRESKDRSERCDIVNDFKYSKLTLSLAVDEYGRVQATTGHASRLNSVQIECLRKAIEGDVSTSPGESFTIDHVTLTVD